MKEVALKKHHKKEFHAVIYLKIPFYPYQPSFGAMSFFFLILPKYRTLISQTAHHQKKKTALNVLLRRTNIANEIYDGQTMQTKFVRFRQKSSGY